MVCSPTFTREKQTNAAKYAMDPMGSTRFVLFFIFGSLVARHSTEKSPGETVVARKELKFPAPPIGGFGDGWDSSKKDHSKVWGEQNHG